MSGRCWLAVGCVAALGGGVRAASIPKAVVEMLEKADRWEVLSLEPNTPAEAPAEDFRGWEVVGKTTVSDPKERAKLLDALTAGVKAYTDEQNTARCFRPRHGIRVRYNGKSMDMVICFSCEKIRAYIAGNDEEYFFVKDKSADTFNAFLKANNVALPKN